MLPTLPERWKVLSERLSARAALTPPAATTTAPKEKKEEEEPLPLQLSLPEQRPTTLPLSRPSSSASLELQGSFACPFAEALRLRLLPVMRTTTTTTTTI